ncbi:DUF998 domain-containing protein [Streptosporangium sandarakinum]|uniref:DUF998 domain-containing protein n=1 Tax=Streptosporangium sandarakinum TaxID=1260955 RepID=UPI0036CB741C
MRGDPVRADGADGEGTLWRRPAMACVGVAAAAMAYAHLAAIGSVDPMTELTSRYALFGPSGWAMAVAAIALAVSCVWTAYGLTRVDPARSAAARVLLVAAALGLLLTAVFPTDAPPGVTSGGGEVHRWAAAVVLTALPCAGRLLGRRFGEPALSLAAGLSVAALVAFLAARPGSPVAEIVGGSGYHGLLERLALLADTAVVFLAARCADGRDAPARAARPLGASFEAGPVLLEREMKPTGQ